MFDSLADPAFWSGLVLLTLLNVVLISDIATAIREGTGTDDDDEDPRVLRAPMGLVAGVTVLILLGVLWLVGLDRTAFSLPFWSPGWGQVALGVGGIFLIYRAFGDLTVLLETGEPSRFDPRGPAFAVLIGVVLSVDVVLLGVGISPYGPAIVAAIVLAHLVVVLAPIKIARFIDGQPALRGLVLAVLVLAGTGLLAQSADMALESPIIHLAAFAALAIWLLSLPFKRDRAVIADTAQSAQPVSETARSEPLFEETAMVQDLEGGLEPVLFEETMKPEADPIPVVEAEMETAEIAFVDNPEPVEDDVVFEDEAPQQEDAAEPPLGEEGERVQKSRAKRGLMRRRPERRRTGKRREQV